MRSKGLLALLPLTLLIASCEQSQTRPAMTTPPLTQNSANSSLPSSAIKLPTERYVNCSALGHGQVSVHDTTNTLAWVLRLMNVIDATCGKMA